MPSTCKDKHGAVVPPLQDHTLPNGCPTMSEAPLQYTRGGKESTHSRFNNQISTFLSPWDCTLHCVLEGQFSSSPACSPSSLWTRCSCIERDTKQIDTESGAKTVDTVEPMNKEPPKRGHNTPITSLQRTLFKAPNAYF